MKKKRKILCCSIIIILLMMLAIFAGQEKEDTFVFRYAFLYKKGDGTIGAVDPGLRFTGLKTGESLRVYIYPVTHSYIYLYLHNSEGYLSLMFPKTFDSFSNDYQPGISYFLPSLETWYRLTEPPGTEEFHLIVSRNRLFRLEARTNLYLSPAGSRERENIKQDILDMIKGYKNDMYRDMYSINGKPVPFAGVIRTLDDEGLTAREISAAGVYAKTIRIRH